MSDISFLKNQIQQLKEKITSYEDYQKDYDLIKSRLDLSLSAGNLAWWEWNFKTGEVHSNENKVTMLGYTMEDFSDATYHSFTNLVHPDDYERVMKAMRDHLEGKKDLYEVEYRIQKKDGTYIWFYDRGSVTDKDENGKPLKVKGIVFDNTERHEILEKLKAKEEELREANAAKDYFFSIISHDLRGPIGSILQLSELFYQQYDELEEDRKKTFIENIFKSTRASYELLENLLEWSRLQRNMIEFFPENLYIKYIVDEIKSLFYSQLNEKNITIENNIPDQTKIRADVNMIKTILRNLISNAIKYSDKNSSIIISAQLNNGEAEVAVTDHGIGMDKAKIIELINQDKQKIQEGTKGEKGTGLGLQLCKAFIAQNGGKIWVDSEVGKGSTFKFTLPKAKS